MRIVSFLAASGGARVGELLADHTISGVRAHTMIEWLSGSGRERTAERFELADVRLLAPIPNPPSIRDFYAYEGHVAAGFRLRGTKIPDAWYEAPAFYFTNPAAVFGPGEQSAGRPAASGSTSSSRSQRRSAPTGRSPDSCS